MMSGIAFGLAIDAVLAALLLTSIVVGLRVHRRLSEVRRAQTELADLVVQLDRATEKARSAVGELRTAGSEAREILTGDMSRARALADELSLIAEAGDNLATRLEERLTEAGKQIRAQDKGRTDAEEKAADLRQRVTKPDPGAEPSARPKAAAADHGGDRPATASSRRSYDDLEALFGAGPDDEAEMSPQEAILAALKNVR